jgi:hypothetical protein
MLPIFTFSQLPPEFRLWPAHSHQRAPCRDRSWPPPRTKRMGHGVNLSAPWPAPEFPMKNWYLTVGNGELPNKWRFFPGKMTEINGGFSSKPRLMTPEGNHEFHAEQGWMKHNIRMGWWNPNALVYITNENANLNQLQWQFTQPNISTNKNVLSHKKHGDVIWCSWQTMRLEQPEIVL